MADRLEFQGKLGWILEEAKRQDNRIRKEEIEKYFEDDHLSDEQMELVYDYLLSQKVAVSGYERKHGRILTEEEREKSYSEEEKRYLRNYQMELREVQGELKGLSEKAQRRDGQKDYPGRTCPLYGQERGGNPLCFKACGRGSERRRRKLTDKQSAVPEQIRERRFVVF